MDQFGWALADLIPGAVRCVELGPAARPASSRSCCRPRCWRSATPSPRRGPSPRTRSPRGWPAPPAPSASCCVKPVAGLYRTWPPAGEPIARLTVDELAALRPAGVDAHLPAALRAAGVETWVIDGREPARLAELLDEGRTAGTLVIARRTARWLQRTSTAAG